MWIWSKIQGQVLIQVLPLTKLETCSFEDRSAGEMEDEVISNGKVDWGDCSGGSACHCVVAPRNCCGRTEGIVGVVEADMTSRA